MAREKGGGGWFLRTRAFLRWIARLPIFKADFGTLLCWGYKWIGEKKVYVPSLLDFPGKNPIDDRALLREVHRVMSEADAYLTYYGKGFDLPFLQAKFLEYGMPMLPPVPHIDIYFTVKSNLSLSRKSLANVSEFLNLEGKKTPVAGRIWKRAMVGDLSAMKYIVAHCRADVDLLEEAYFKLRPLIRQHPRLGPDGCKTCGGQVIRRKIRYTATGLTRYQYGCKACGSFETRAK